MQSNVFHLPSRQISSAPAPETQASPSDARPAEALAALAASFRSFHVALAKAELADLLLIGLDQSDLPADTRETLRAVITLSALDD